MDCMFKHAHTQTGGQLEEGPCFRSARLPPQLPKMLQHQPRSLSLKARPVLDVAWPLLARPELLHTYIIMWQHTCTMPVFLTPTLLHLQMSPRQAVAVHAIKLHHDAHNLVEGRDPVRARVEEDG